MDAQRISWAGGLVVLGSILPALLFLLSPSPDPHMSSPIAPRQQIEAPPLDLNLSLASDLAVLAPVVSEASQQQISFSLDPVRPDVRGASTHFLIRLKDSRQMKRVEMPARIGLAFDPQGTLQFSSDASLFWLECHLLADERIGASLLYRTPGGHVVTQAEWVPTLIQTPFQMADEFAPESPFRELAEARWLGSDLLQQKVRGGSAVYRLEVGAPGNGRMFDVREGDWLSYTGKTWEKCDSPDAPSKNWVDQNLPIAHIQSANSQWLEVEGWNGMAHLRFRWAPAPSSPFKLKMDELFSQIRVRSEKQVSCMIEKQCLVLRPGDWVLKIGGRWKALRKPEEKEGVMRGDLVGELFVLEKIGIAGTARNIVGSYFSAARTQSFPVELAQKTQKARRANR